MDIRIDQILFQIINFGVVFGALSYFLYKPVIKLLEERSKKVQQAEEAAQETMRARDSIESEKKTSKTQAEKESAAMLEKTKLQAQELKKELSQKAKEEVKTEREKALKALELEKKSARTAMEKEMADAVYLVTEKVLGKALDKKEHAALIDRSIKEIASLM